MESGGKLSLEEKLAQDPAWMQRLAVERLLKNLPVIILVVPLLLFYGYFLAHKIDLTTADLGRHIKNGEILLQDASVLERNFYSYTNPNFPIINHHWGSGLLFYFVWRHSGFVGVQAFFILPSLAALAVFLAAARLYAGWGVVGFAALLALPLLAERTEIRPEVFSYLFAGIFFFLLSRFREAPDRTHFRLLYLLPIIQALWVNTHIYFLLGPLLVGAFLLESLISRREAFLKLLGTFGAVLAATLVNPFGYKAVTAALTLFENFGYRLAENQSVWFLERLGMVGPNFYIFQGALVLLILSFVWLAVKRRIFNRLAALFVALGIATLAALAVRNLALFGFFLIPLLSANISLIWSGGESRNLARSAAWCSAAALLLAVLLGLPRYFPYWRGFGFGLEAGNSATSDFLRVNEVRGPYFNNYDIGGYLIFHLFPQEKVFVDNRPEAYPVEFFTEQYIPMQENEGKWREALSRYGFNAIVFSYHDATPWGQQFLVSRMKDSEWTPVFADSKALVFVRQTEENEAIVKKYEISRDSFVFR